MISVGAVLFFWGVLIFSVGAPSFAYFCNIDDQHNDEEKRSLLWLCVAFGAVILGVLLSLAGLILSNPHS